MKSTDKFKYWDLARKSSSKDNLSWNSLEKPKEDFFFNASVQVWIKVSIKSHQLYKAVGVLMLFSAKRTYNMHVHSRKISG